MSCANVSRLNTSNLNDASMEDITGDDAAWLLSCAFLIFTMQTGFAMLECGCVSSKNTANIMVKNVIDVSIGGMGYWLFGYALSFGDCSYPFVSYNHFFFDGDGRSNLATLYIKYFFQLSFATTATTIVSGAVAERMRLDAYILFSFFNNIIYCFPAQWAWNQEGWLFKLGFYDYAGVGVVHMCGGVSALVGAIMLGPRLNRFKYPEKFGMSSPVTALTGMFMLWWAWLAFNCGSAFGISNGLWRIAAHVAVTTLNAATGGGIAGILLSYVVRNRKVVLDYVINSVLGGLVSVTGIAPLTTTAEAIPIGIIGALIAIGMAEVLIKLKIDDPVSASAVHFCAGIWGVLCIGLMAAGSPVNDELNKIKGLFHGGGMRQLGVQALGCISIATWSAVITFLTLYSLKKTIGIRMSEEDELLGADWVEHELKSDMLSQQLEAVLGDLNSEQMKRLIFAISKNEGKHVDQNRIFAVERNKNEIEKPKTGSINVQEMFSKQMSKNEIIDAQQQERKSQKLLDTMIRKVSATTIAVHPIKENNGHEENGSRNVSPSKSDDGKRKKQQGMYMSSTLRR